MSPGLGNTLLHQPVSGGVRCKGFSGSQTKFNWAGSDFSHDVPVQQIYAVGYASPALSLFET